MTAYYQRRVNAPVRPFIGPCMDALDLWFLQWCDKQGRVWRRYYADRAEAQKALRARKKKAVLR